MFQTLLVTGVSPLQNKDEINHWENHPFTGGWPEAVNRKTDITRNRTIKKKKKRVRTAFTTDQIRTLEKTFLKNKYINADNRRELSKQLKIDDKCIKIWFQNKRMKEKRESSESSDSSSENARDMVSPPLTQHEPQVDHKPDVFHDQYQISSNYQAPYNYYQPQMLYTHNVSTQDLAYEPHTNNGYIENDFSGMVFSNETNPYPTQYYPNDEAGINNLMCQNQYQYTNEMYNYWCTDNIDPYNFHQ